ncbi:MAG: AbrB/MazE/SpoVT family DNA-binding domain-containing protein [Candidatus Omnitrophica bacterium]|nr:AbrB/MazE/SpoVT family DNA-binding domain-containing protein [Candidatus Omnitrophota bacterium]
MSKRGGYRKIGVTGKTNSYFVVIPKDIIKHLNWRKGQRVTARRYGKKIIIEDWAG